tara:strand:- start:501 stop:731 length:231 start_codon:yes stop_codon:yes gene_type:complete
MPRKYEGEPELSKHEKMASEIAAAKAEKPWHPRQLKVDPKPVGEIRKQQGKPKFNIPFKEKNRQDEKRTFKYRPMA